MYNFVIYPLISVIKPGLKLKTLILAAALLFGGGNYSYPEKFPVDNFIYAQLKYSGSWDPYPSAHQLMSYYLTNTTSIIMPAERKILTLSDDELFYFPFLLFTGRGAYPEFTGEEIRNLRNFIRGGGIVFIDTAGDPEFSAAADRTFKRVFPDKNFKRIPEEHSVFRSFYLVKYVSGREINRPYLSGIEVESKISVIRSDNDLPGVWPGDRAGNWEYQLFPDRPGQRKEAIKLTLNIFVYAVSGTYKSDEVHQPFIQRKLRR